MSQTIFRGQLLRDFTTLPNGMLRDSRLSFKARGLLAMVLSNTDDWIVHKGWLEQQTTEGREAIRSALKELKSLGYVTSRDEPVKGGKFSRKVWLFYGTPTTVDGKPSTVNRERETVDGNPSTKKEHKETPRKKAPAVPPDSSSILSKWPNLDTIEFHEAWADWESHRLEIRKKLTPSTVNKQLAFLHKLGSDRAVAALNHSITNGYTGIFEEKPAGTSQRGDRNRNAGTFNEGKSHLYAGIQRLAKASTSR